MKVLILGNMGYVGPGVVSLLRSRYPEAELIGFDIGFFAHALTNVEFQPEIQLNKQIFGDVREFPYELLKGIDAVVYLAAISNDPMSAIYEEMTMDINYRSCIRIAKKAREFGVKSFVFASSCSIYGSADQYPKKESNTLNPLTAYARSKVAAEKELEPLANNDFTVTCLRFATACGMSKRLRLDLVLNDFVAGAIISKEINILSDGTPWRPLINTMDMALAIDWAIGRSSDNGGKFLAVNTGTSSWNYQVKDLAYAVSELIPGCKVTINKDAQPDKRSYRVNFDLFKRLAPKHQPQYGLKTTIEDLYKGISEMGLNDPNFRESKYMRLKILSGLQAQGLVNENLQWNIEPSIKKELVDHDI